ncbi:unnamed protein product [Caenorhabditis sp. 36 PRJEB53466]|nr:unnamed protein product [Caenorhabditis sp. 36 PRJEB53466]
MGGFTIDPLNSLNLDEDYNNVLKLRESTVLISFGSVIQSADMPLSFKNGIIEMFHKLPDITFICKYEVDDESILKRFPEDVILKKWVSQPEFLADKQVTKNTSERNPSQRMSSKNLFLAFFVGAFLTSTIGTYPFVDMYFLESLRTTPPYVEDRACGLKIRERMRDLCGHCTRGDSDLAVRKCSLNVSDEELMDGCCPDNIKTTTAMPLPLTGPVFPSLQNSKSTREPEKSLITTDGQ